MNRSARSLILFLVILSLGSAMAAAQNTEFTYQGVLKMNGKLPTGNFDFIFTLYDGPDPVYDNPLGPESAHSPLFVDQGRFDVKLAFGDEFFDGRELWVQTCVRETGTVTLVCLAPLQELTPIPYATFAVRSASAEDSNTLNGLSSTDFLQRVASCKVCIGHADSDGLQPNGSQCFGLNETGRDNGNFLALSGNVDSNDRLWLWIDCP